MIEVRALQITAINDEKSAQSENPRSSGPQPALDTRLKRWFWAIAAVLIVLYGAELWLHAMNTSVTYDEPVFIYSGYHFWKCGDHGINPENPPLLALVAAMPLRNDALNAPAPLCPMAFTSKFGEYVEAMQFLVANRIKPVVVPARLVCTVFSFALAMLLIFATRRMFGDAEALVAMALLAFEPNMIAHGSLATTDMAATASFFAGMFALYLFFEKPCIWRSIILGLAVGCMLTTKHSGVAALIFLWVLMVCAAWFAATKDGSKLTGLLRQIRIGASGLGAATIIGILCLWASYGFHSAIPAANRQMLPATALDPGTGGVPGLISEITNWARDIRILPEPYLFGITDVLRQNINHAAFLLGTVHVHGVWYYFPVAFGVKTSLALLGMLVIGLYAVARFREKRREHIFLLVPALCYFAFALTSGLDIGVRHILPIYPFIISVAAAGACALAGRFPKVWIVILGLLAFGGVDSARTYPNYIAYSNELWGGTSNTYRYLSDSNADWGQTLPQIEAYIAEHHVQQCWIAAAGTPDIALATLPCHLLLARYQWMVHPLEDLPTTISGTIFLSDETLPAEYPGVYDSIVNSMKPSAVIGGATFAYTGTFDVTQAALLIHISNSKFYSEHGLLANAIGEMKAAIEIDPNDPRAHFVLGMYFAASGQAQAARDEFNRCIAIAGTSPALVQVRDVAQQQLSELR